MATPGRTEAAPRRRGGIAMTDTAGTTEAQGPQRILLAVDGSPSSSVAVDLVAGIDWPAGATIRVVEAIETGAALFGGPWPSVALVQSDTLEASVHEEAKRNVEDARSRLARPGLTVEERVLDGRPSVAIVDDALRIHADLIVMGSRGHGRLEEMLLGSTSSEVVDHAHTPVLVARRRRLDRVVFAWDGSSCARAASRRIADWRIFAGSTIRVVTVADVEVPWWTGVPEAGALQVAPDIIEAAEGSRRLHDDLARDMTAEFAAAGFHATAERRDGDPATEILAAATASGADIIVIGTHGRTGLARLAKGSVAGKVLHHATSSVLIVREAPAGA
jgi:nucleotide-binding universal stress UspA family protein